MFYSAIPIVPLQPFIENIWYCNRHVATTEQTLTLPFGRIELVVNFSGDYYIENQQEKFKGEHSWITGQQSKPSVATISGQHECMGVVFTPLGWTAFSKLQAGELTNKSVPVSDIWGIEVYTLSDELAELKEIEIKFDRLQYFLLKRLMKYDKLATIKAALSIIEANGNGKKVTVNNLCKQLKISRKSLNQQFQKYIGISPSTYLQQKVFNGIIKDICLIRAGRLIEVGYDYHFFDQSHFIKQFQTFSGMTPGQYLQLVKTEAVDKAFPNFLTR